MRKKTVWKWKKTMVKIIRKKKLVKLKKKKVKIMNKKKDTQEIEDNGENNE